MVHILERAFAAGFDAPTDPTIHHAWIDMEAASNRQPTNGGDFLLSIAQVGYEEIKVARAAIMSTAHRIAHVALHS